MVVVWIEGLLPVSVAFDVVLAGVGVVVVVGGLGVVVSLKASHVVG